MALIRPALLAALVYLGYAVAFPDYTGRIYHVVVCAGIAGGVVGLWFLNQMLDLGEGAFKIALEAGFLIGLAVFIGYSMPQRSGKPPLAQWSEGMRPTQSSARRGLRRLGIEPRGFVFDKVLDLLPKR